MVRNPGIVAGIILALVVGSSTRALAGGGRFVPLGGSPGETRRAENVTRDAAGNPLVGGSETVPKGGLREAAMYLIAPNNAVSKQTLTVAAGTRPRRTALYVPRGANIAVGRATDNTGSQSQALLWEDTAGDATPLTPLDKLGNSDSEGGKYYEDEKEGPGAHIIAVGVSYASDFSVFLPTIWTSDNGFVPQQLDLLPGGPMNGAARAIVRNDGMTIIAGTAVGPAGSSEAVIWNGMQVQAVLPRGGLLAANAAAISRDTRFVAGLGISAAFNSVPALWSDEDGDGLYELHTPALPAGLLRGAFNAVRDLPNTRGDGPAAIAVGCSLGPTFEALIFDPDNGVRLLEDVLANDFGLDLQASRWRTPPT
jgi:hypothetical protein